MAKALAVLRPNVVELARSDPEQLIRLAVERSEELYQGNTQTTYNYAWRKWRGWCDELQIVDYVPVLPKPLIGLLEKMHVEGLTRNTIETVLSAISSVDSYARSTDDSTPIPIRKHPRVKRWMSAHGQATKDQPLRQAPALLRPELLAIVCSLQTTGKQTRGLSANHALELLHRDHALLLVGWFGGFRVSTLARFRVSDLAVDAHGLELVLRSSKTDQAGAGKVKYLYAQDVLELCPRAAWLRYLEHRTQVHGEPFGEARAFPSLRGLPMDPQAIADVVARRGELAGVRVTGHSLRAGFATWSKLAGKSESDIQQHGGWQSATSMRGYFRRGDARSQNPTRGLI